MLAQNYLFGSTGGNFFIKPSGGSNSFQMDSTGHISVATINASNLSSGAFGSNTGGGNYSFSGNVGIGTTTPGALLDVAGQIKVGSLGIKFNDGTTQTTAPSAGNGNVINGTIVYFNGACPTGWTEVTAAQGRTIVGLPSGGTLAGTIGTPLSNLEDRTHTHTMPNHQHIIPIGAYSGAGGPATGRHAYGVYGTVPVSFQAYYQTTASNINNPIDSAELTSPAGAGSTGTASTSQVIPYIQYRVCQYTGNSGADASTWGSLNNNIYNLNSGNVGIGTTGLGYKLDINDQTLTGGLTGMRISTYYYPGFYLTSALRANSGKLVLNDYANGYGSGSLQSAMLLQSPGAVQFSTGGDNVRMTVDSTGNVGIGTTSPGYKLDVAGAVRSSSGGFVFPDGTTQTTVASGVPSGAVMFFNLSSCPSGWTDLTSSYGGRYIVAKPSGGTLAATVGTALSNTENRPTGQHTHSINDPGHSHTLWYTQSNGGPGWTNSCGAGPDQMGWSSYTCGFGWISSIISSSVTGITINNAGSVAGTNAPYVQFLLCQKN